MMAHEFEHMIAFEISCTEISAHVTYTCSPGTPDSHDDPGDPPELEVRAIVLRLKQPDGTVRNEPCPPWLLDILSNDDGVRDNLLSSCDWGRDSGEDPDEAYERMRDDHAENDNGR